MGHVFAFGKICERGPMQKFNIEQYELDEIPIKDEIFGAERLKDYARFLANELNISKRKFSFTN